MCDSRQQPDRRDEAGSHDGFRSDRSNLGKAKSPTQITRLSLTHSPHRFSFHSWEIPCWPLASHEVPSVRGAFTLSSLTERRRFIDHVVPGSEFSHAQRWQFALFLSRFHLLLMALIARYKSIVTENRNLRLVVFKTVIKAHRAECGYGLIKYEFYIFVELKKTQIEIIYSFIWNILYAFWATIIFFPHKCSTAV